MTDDLVERGSLDEQSCREIPPVVVRGCKVNNYIQDMEFIVFIMITQGVTKKVKKISPQH